MLGAVFLIVRDKCKIKLASDLFPDELYSIFLDNFSIQLAGSYW